MTALRAALFLLIPLSGVAGWRVWGRETRPLLAGAGGSLAGLAAFWLLLRIFALLFPFSTSAWLAFLIVTVCGLIAALKWRTAPRWTNDDSRAIHIALFSFAVFFGLTVYAASGALFSFDETMTHHLPLIASMQRGNFPPMDLREPPHPLVYHWGQHLLAAGFSQITSLTAWQALFISNAFLAGCAFLLAYALARREASSFAAAFGALLLVAGGTLNWLWAWRYASPSLSFSALMNPLGQPFTTGNTLMGGFFWRLHTNSTAWPACLLLLATDTLWRGMKEHALPALAVAALLLALVAPGSETMLCAGVAGWLAACAVARTGSPRHLLLSSLAACLLAPLMGGTLASFFTTGNASHQASITFNFAHFGSVPSWNANQWFNDPAWLPLLSWRFVQDAGLVPFLLLPALLWTWRQTHSRLLTMALIALASLTAATTLSLTHYPENMFRLVNHAVVLGALPAGAFLAALCEKHRLTRSLAVFALLILIAAWPLSHVGLYWRNGNQLAWPNRTAARAAMDEPAMNWLRANTDFRANLLPLPLAGWNVLPAGQAHPLGSYVGGRGDYATRAQLAAERVDAASLAAAEIRFVYALRTSLAEATRARLEEAIAKGWLTLRWQSVDYDRAIYEVSR